MLISLAVVAGLVVAVPELREAAVTSLSDAYIQVSVFVALTLAIFYGLERGREHRPRRRAAALQGLAGADRGDPRRDARLRRRDPARDAIHPRRVSFGAIVATLTATMGDAAFLIIAKDPPSAAIVIGLCTTAGIAMGYAINCCTRTGSGS
jgi:hypothetical protein